MAIRDLQNNLSFNTSLVPMARTATEEGTSVDLRGFDAAVVEVLIGAYTDGTHTPSLEHSVDGETFTVVSDSDLDGAFSAVSSTDGENAVQSVGYIGDRRYVRVVLTVADAISGALSSASVVAGYPHNAPVQ